MFSTGSFEKIFDVPVGAQLLVQTGSAVTAGDALYRAAEKEAPAVIFASAILDVNPSAIGNFISKSEGEYIEFDEILAQKGTLPLIRKIVRSPIAGIVEQIDTVRGIVIVRPKKIHREFYSVLTGKVSQLSEKTVTVESPGMSVVGAYGEGSAMYGTFQWLEKYTDMQSEGQKIIFGIKQWTPAVEQLLCNIVKRNSIGVVAASVPAAWIEKKQGQIPYIVTEGLGEFAMSSIIVNVLNQCELKTVSIFPETKVYAGAIRPSIVCFGIDAAVLPRVSSQTVRLLRSPYLGVYGTLLDAPASGHLLSVRTERGDVILAPSQNIEVL